MHKHTRVLTLQAWTAYDVSAEWAGCTHRKAIPVHACCATNKEARKLAQLQMFAGNTHNQLFFLRALEQWEDSVSHKGVVFCAKGEVWCNANEFQVPWQQNKWELPRWESHFLKLFNLHGETNYPHMGGQPPTAITYLYLLLWSNRYTFSGRNHTQARKAAGSQVARVRRKNNFQIKSKRVSERANYCLVGEYRKCKV